VITTSANVLEDLVKIRWGKAAEGLISIARRDAALRKIELASPNPELAYILRANREFGP
jgi:hypothetical protein